MASRWSCARRRSLTSRRSRGKPKPRGSTRSRPAVAGSTATPGSAPPFHTVDPPEMAFKIAGSLAFKKAALAAKPVLLEPIAEMEVVIPEENVGDIIGDLNGRRGRVLGGGAPGESQGVRGQGPVAEVLRYSSDLRSITSGRGQFTMKVSHYEEIPAAIAAKAIAESKKELGEEGEEGAV